MNKEHSTEPLATDTPPRPATPLPWIIRTGNASFTSAIEDREGYAIVSAAARKTDYGIRRDADADYLVEACNAYLALRSQRDSLVSALEQIAADCHECSLGEGIEVGEKRAWVSVHRQARAALASVRGKQG